MDFWEVLEVEGVEWDIDEMGVEITPVPENEAISCPQSEIEGRRIDMKRLQRRIELEHRKQELYEKEVKEKAQKYFKMLDALLSRLGKDPELAGELLYWKEVLRRPRITVGVLEDFVKFVEPLIYQKPATEPQSRKEQFLELLNSNKTSRKSRKSRKAKRTYEIPQTARFRLYLFRGNRAWLVYTNSLSIEALQQIKETKFTKFTRTDKKGVYLLNGDVIAVPIKKDELTILKQSRKFMSLAETIKAVEEVRRSRQERRISPEQIRNALIGFYRLFGV